MDAKIYLRQIRRIEILIDNKQKEIDALRSKLICSGTSFEEKVQTSKTNNREKNLLALLEYQHELNETIDSLIDIKREVSNVIDQLENPEAIDILYKRYFQFMKWEDIAFLKGYTMQGIHKLHAKALKDIQSILSCITK